MAFSAALDGFSFPESYIPPTLPNSLTRVTGNPKTKRFVSLAEMILLILSSQESSNIVLR